MAAPTLEEFKALAAKQSAPAAPASSAPPTPEQFALLAKQQASTALPAVQHAAAPTPAQFAQLAKSQNVPVEPVTYDAQAKQRTGGGAFNEASSVSDENPILSTIREVLTASPVAEAPTEFGLRKPVGADRTEQLKRM